MVWQQDVAIDKFGAIFRDSDKDTGNIDDDNSNINLEGIKEDAEENDEEDNHQSADCIEDLEEAWWMAELCDIDVK